MLYAQVDNSVFISLVFLNPDTYATWLATNNPKLNKYYEFIDTVPPVPSNTEVVTEEYVVNTNEKRVTRNYILRNKTPDELRQIWTSYEFLNRLTASERADIRQRALTDHNVADFLMLATAAQEVLSDDPVTIMGMDYMVMIGVFTQARRNEILGE